MSVFTAGNFSKIGYFAIGYLSSCDVVLFLNAVFICGSGCPVFVYLRVIANFRLVNGGASVSLCLRIFLDTWNFSGWDGAVHALATICRRDHCHPDVDGVRLYSKTRAFKDYLTASMALAECGFGLKVLLIK